MRLTSALITLLTLCVFAIANPAASAHAQPAPAAASSVYLPLLKGTPGVQTVEQQAAAAQVLDLINAERAKAGCGPVSIDQKLTVAAQNHSNDMAANNFFDHRGSAGSQVSDRVTAAGYTWRRVGENIAAGYTTAAEVVAGWMDSPGHRANILNCTYVHTGVGYVFDPADAPLAGSGWPYRYYWTQVFAAPR